MDIRIIKLFKCISPQLFAILLSSCFEFEGLPENEVFNDVQTNIPVIDFFTIPDTFYVRGHVYFNMEFETSERILGHELYIDSERISEGEGTPQSFYFSSRDLPDGFKKMELTLYIKSRTGSIADQVDAEALIVTYSKVLLIDNTSKLEAPVVSGFEIRDGELYLVFEPYADFGFEKWQLYWEGPPIESLNQSESAILIPGYGGQEISVKLILWAKNQRQEVVSNYAFEHDVMFKEMENGDLEITWNHIPFNSLKSVIIHNADTTIELTHETKALIINKPHPFPDNRKVTFVTWRNLNGGGVSQGTSAYYWLRDNLITGIASDASYRELYYCFRNDSIVSVFVRQDNFRFTVINYLIELQKGSKNDKITEINRATNVVFSQDYKKVFSLSSNGYRQLDPMTFQIVESHNYPSGIGGISVVSIYINNVDENKMAFVRNNRTLLSIYDFEKNQFSSQFQMEYCDSYKSRVGFHMINDSLFVTNPINGESLINYSYKSFVNCAGFYNLFWFSKGYTIQFRNNNEVINYLDENRDLVAALDAPEFIGTPHIFDDFLYLKDPFGNVEIRDLNDNLSLVLELPIPENIYFPTYRLKDNVLYHGNESIYFRKIK